MGLAQGIDIEDGKHNSPRRAWSAQQREGECATQSTALKSELVRYGLFLGLHLGSGLMPQGNNEPGTHGGYGRHGRRPP